MKMQQETRKKFYRFAARRMCPPLAIAFSIIVTITTLYINEEISPIFVFISVQVYLNWYAICTISQSTTTIKSPSIELYKSSRDLSQSMKCWHCEKCDKNTIKPTQHCGICKKCFHYRDHHCFFIGGCIIQQNMGTFILVCFHTSLACLYSLIVLGPYLYENLQEVIDKDPNLWKILLNFCFPVALANVTFFGHTSYFLLVTLFNILFSLCLVCMLYGTWKLFCCLTGRQRYYPHLPRKQKLNDLFGNYGIYNFLFPYNALIKVKTINQNYGPKEV